MFVTWKKELVLIEAYYNNCTAHCLTGQTQQIFVLPE